jgi:predicted nucleic acid-binding protein
MTALVFVDTNVLLYARDAGEPAKQPRAAAWLERLWREQLGRTSVQVLSEYYVNVTRKLSPGLSPEDAWEDVRALLTWHPQVADESLLIRGREIERRFRLSWWDSLIVAAAQLQGCAVLLTEDLQDGAVFESLTVRSPFTLRAEEGSAAYTLAPGALRAHPARGRPRGARR